MARDSSAPRIACAAPVELRAKRLVSFRVATPSVSQRKALSNQRAAIALLQLRLQNGLTQTEVAEESGDTSRTIGNYERGDVDLGALRVYLLLKMRLEKGQR